MGVIIITLVALVNINLILIFVKHAVYIISQMSSGND